jgi:nitrite reductase/ring-hydroxylating ferredoxin subunit
MTCGCHGAQFDVTNGKVLAPPAPSPLKTYSIRRQNGDWVIEV